MDLSFTEEQVLLRETVRRLCDDHMSLADVRKWENTETGYSPEFWTQLCEMGITGLRVPEEDGGLGMGAVDEVVVYEEFGTELALSPHFHSSVLATAFLARAATAAQKSRWLPDIVSGEMVCAVAWLEPGNGYGARGIQLSAEEDAGSYSLTGAKTLVPYANTATHILVLSRTGSGPEDVAAFVVECGMTGMQVRNQPTQSGEAVCKVTFDSVQVGAEARVGDGASIWAEWEMAVSEANISNAALAIGSATRIHELATEYSKVREAFGQPIGGFQAIAHYLADSLVEIEGTRTLVYQAAWARDNGHDFVQLAAMAKMQACDVFARTTSKAVQIHGGLGCTMEADPQLYYRRAKQQQLMYWDPAYLEDKIATLIFGEIEAV